MRLPLLLLLCCHCFLPLLSATAAAAAPLSLPFHKICDNASQLLAAALLLAVQYGS
jgi:hypothetical protein